MSFNNTSKSLTLVSIFLLSLFSAMITIPIVSAVNETTSGTIVGTETWTGVMNLNGDIYVAGGAKLIINAGTTINLPANRSIQVAGSICAGDSTCGASQASTGSPVRFKWADAPTAGENETGRCYVTGVQNPDMACGSGLYIESTIDQSLTRLTHTTFDGAYGIPVDIDGAGTIKYGALVFAGASVITNSLTFTAINTTNVLVFDGAAPTFDSGTFVVGDDGQGYQGAAIQAYGAGAGLITMNIANSVFTGSEEDCESNGGGRSAVYLENSFINIDSISVSQNSYGVFLRSSSGWLTNSTFTTKCNSIDTNSRLETFGISHTLTISDNTITPVEGTGITAYDGAIVVAERNTISGASSGSAYGIRSSNVTINNNIIGPIEGWNGLWIYGSSDVSAENNTIMNTAKEPVLIGEYHYEDEGWNVPDPTKARIYFANNIISNNSGTCNSDYMYGGDFNCPAFHVFMSSGTFIGNTVTDNSGDGFRIKGGIVNAQDNDIEVGGFAVNISHFDDNYNNKYGSIGYFSGNTYTNASQIYNVTESRVAIQSETMPDPGAGELYPVSLSWDGQECPWNLNECLQTPPTAIWPPAFMPLAMEVNTNATTFTYSDIQNFDRSKIHIQNQDTASGVQVQQGELVRYQVKADNSQVADAKVIVKDSTGRPLYNMSTDSYGYTPWVTLPSDFHLDTNWNHFAVDDGEDSCGDGIDNDGDTLKDGQDPDCATGRELPLYFVDAKRFGKGTANHSFTLSGMIDEVIHLSNSAPSVAVDQADGASFARTVTLTGSAHDGIGGPYFNDYDSWNSQFGDIRMVEIQPHGSLDWSLATDTSGSNGSITELNWPFKTWSFERDMGDHFEEDVTFRIRSSDGLAESVVSTRVFKLNINPPIINLDSPLDGSSYDGQEVLFTGTANDDYTGVQGSDIRDIWFHVEGPNSYSANYPASSGGGTSWSDTWNFSSLPSGLYTFTVWASDSNYCHEVVDICESETVTINVDNDNLIPIVQVSEPLPMQAVRADKETVISGVARDNDGQVTRVEITITDLAGDFELNDGPNHVTTFQSNGAWIAYWDTSKLVHDQQYEISVVSYDGIDYSTAEIVRIIIDSPTDANNIAPSFNPDGWISSIPIFCDENSKVFDKCNGGATINLLDYFNDSDGAGPATNHFIWDIYDDPTTALDDTYFDFVTIDAQGVATYNPIANLQALSPDMAEWSLTGVMFEARDAHDSVAFSYTVNFIVKGVAFTAKRIDDGPLVFGDPANYEGTGLPGSQVKARLVDGDIIVNSTLVKADGIWAMDISSSQLGDDGNYAIYFIQDGQTIGKDSDSSAITLQAGNPDAGEISSWMLIGLSVVAVIILLGVGAFFFLEFEDFEEEEDGSAATKEVEEDPYAWAKKRAAEQAAAAAPAPQPAEQPQHPGWIWDAQANQWAPDPNYQPPTQ